MAEEEISSGVVPEDDPEFVSVGKEEAETEEDLQKNVLTAEDAPRIDPHAPDYSSVKNPWWTIPRRRVFGGIWAGVVSLSWILLSALLFTHVGTSGKMIFGSLFGLLVGATPWGVTRLLCYNNRDRMAARAISVWVLVLINAILCFALSDGYRVIALWIAGYLLPSAAGAAYLAFRQKGLKWGIFSALSGGIDLLFLLLFAIVRYGSWAVYQQNLIGVLGGASLFAIFWLFMIERKSWEEETPHAFAVGGLILLNTILCVVLPRQYRNIALWIDIYSIASCIYMIVLGKLHHFEKKWKVVNIVEMVFAIVMFPLFVMITLAPWQSCAHYIGFSLGAASLVIVRVLIHRWKDKEDLAVHAFLIGIFILVAILLGYALPSTFSITAIWFLVYAILSCGFEAFLAFYGHDRNWGVVALVQAAVALSAMITLAVYAPYEYPVDGWTLGLFIGIYGGLDAMFVIWGFTCMESGFPAYDRYFILLGALLGLTFLLICIPVEGFAVAGLSFAGYGLLSCARVCYLKRFDEEKRWISISEISAAIFLILFGVLRGRLFGVDLSWVAWQCVLGAFFAPGILLAAWWIGRKDMRRMDFDLPLLAGITALVLNLALVFILTKHYKVIALWFAATTLISSGYAAHRAFGEKCPGRGIAGVAESMLALASITIAALI